MFEMNKKPKKSTCTSEFIESAVKTANPTQKRDSVKNGHKHLLQKKLGKIAVNCIELEVVNKHMSGLPRAYLASVNTEIVKKTIFLWLFGL